MNQCPMCKGVGKIPQRGAETSGAREICPTCNGVGTVPEGTNPTHVYNAPVEASEIQADVQVDEQVATPIESPKVDGAGSSGSSEEDNAPTDTEATGVQDNQAGDGSDTQSAQGEQVAP